MSFWDDLVKGFEAKPVTITKAVTGGRGTIVETAGDRRKAIEEQKAKDLADQRAKEHDERQRKKEEAKKREQEEAAQKVIDDAAQKVIDDAAAQKVIDDALARQIAEDEIEAEKKAAMEQKVEDERIAEEKRVADEFEAELAIQAELDAKATEAAATEEEAPTWADGELQWSDVGDFFDETVSNITDTATEVWDSITGGSNSDTSTTDDGGFSIGDIGSTVESGFDTVTDFVGDVGTGISDFWDSITGAFTGGEEDIATITANSNAERALVMADLLKNNTNKTAYEEALATYDLNVGKDTGSVTIDEAIAFDEAKDTIADEVVTDVDTGSDTSAPIDVVDIEGVISNQSSVQDLEALQAADSLFNQELVNQFQAAATAAPGTYQNLTGNPNMVQSGAGGNTTQLSNVFMPNSMMTGQIDTNRAKGGALNGMQVQPGYSQFLNSAGAAANAAGTFNSQNPSQYLNQSGTSYLSQQTGGK